MSLGVFRSLLGEAKGQHVKYQLESVKTLEGSRVGGVPSRLGKCKCRLICVECTEKAVSYVEHCTVNVSHLMSLLYKLCPQSSKSVVMWVGCDGCKKKPSLNGWPWHLCEVLWVFNKSPTGMELPLWRLSCN